MVPQCTLQIRMGVQEEFCEIEMIDMSGNTSFQVSKWWRWMPQTPVLIIFPKPRPWKLFWSSKGNRKDKKFIVYETASDSFHLSFRLCQQRWSILCPHFFSEKGKFEFPRISWILHQNIVLPATLRESWVHHCINTLSVVSEAPMVAQSCFSYFGFGSCWIR